MRRILLLSILGTLIGVGCGPRYDEEAEQVKKMEAEALQKDLQGSWLGLCVSNSQKSLPAKMERVQYTFEDGYYLERHYGYTTTECTGEMLYTLRKMGPFEVLEKRNKENPSLPRKTNLGRSEIDLIPNTAAFIDYLRSNKICGTTEWSLGRPQSVGNKDCWGNTEFPKTLLHDIFALTNDDKKLCFGNTADPVLNGVKPSTRPLVLGPCYTTTDIKN